MDFVREAKKEDEERKDATGHSVWPVEGERARRAPDGPGLGSFGAHCRSSRDTGQTGRPAAGGAVPVPSSPGRPYGS